ncbi:hypothetical protein CC80DRAFT_23493 [Byssothecium circinans]|uniref:Uncharacterized protein n=1 Tax=Byssothecium circinans TaxID=147558 RepID=A0A6A5U4Q4_9PLEO|nr:hypothetical protein CC80DRAFT_23493 [Byssothecium circinans]
MFRTAISRVTRPSVVALQGKSAAQDVTTAKPRDSIKTLTMTTCSPCDPGATHILNSAIVMSPTTFYLPRDPPPPPSPPALEEATESEVTPSNTPTSPDMSTAPTATALPSKSPISTTTATAAVPKKYWPFTLPRFLQPKEGTTYYTTLHPTKSPIANRVQIRKPPSILQAILYGVPDPEKYKMHKQILQALSRVLRAVVFGVREERVKVVEAAKRVEHVVEAAKTVEGVVEARQTVEDGRGEVKKAVMGIETVEREVMEEDGDDVVVRETKTEVMKVQRKREMMRYGEEEEEENGGQMFAK